MQFFYKKMTILYFGFWLQEGKKKPKRASRDPKEDNKFYIWDGTKHNLKIFGILYFIILKYLALCILHSTKN